jgi:hypothetical protein
LKSIVAEQALDIRAAEESCVAAASAVMRCVAATMIAICATNEQAKAKLIVL